VPNSTAINAVKLGQKKCVTILSGILFGVISGTKITHFTFTQQLQLHTSSVTNIIPQVTNLSHFSLTMYGDLKGENFTKSIAKFLFYLKMKYNKEYDDLEIITTSQSAIYSLGLVSCHGQI